MPATERERDDNPYAPPASSLDLPSSIGPGELGLIPPLGPRARLALIFLRISLAVSCVGVLGSLAAGGRSSADVEIAWAVYGFIVFPILLASSVTYFLWLHRAVLRLRRAGRPISASPAWAVLSWFVPVVNFVVPYRAVRDLWRRSHAGPSGDAGPAPAIVAVWWAVWVSELLVTLLPLPLGFNEPIVDLLANSSAFKLAFELVSSTLALVELLLSLRIVTAITRAQVRSLGDGVAA